MKYNLLDRPPTSTLPCLPKWLYAEDTRRHRRRGNRRHQRSDLRRHKQTRQRERRHQTQLDDGWPESVEEHSERCKYEDLIA